MRQRILAINEEIAKLKNLLDPLKIQKKAAIERVDQIQMAIDSLETEKSTIQSDINS